MIQWVKDTAAFQMVKWALQYALRFEGRATRSEFLKILLCSVTIGWLIGRAFNQDIFKNDNSLLENASFSIFLYLNLAPIFCVTVRRFHDTSRNAWAFLVVIFPYAGLFMLAILLFLDGDDGPNNYGPDPRAGRK